MSQVTQGNKDLKYINIFQQNYIGSTYIFKNLFALLKNKNPYILALQDNFLQVGKLFLVQGFIAIYLLKKNN